MRLRVFNDLHVNFGDFDPPPQPADVVILAGDIHHGVAGVEWAAVHWPDTPVVFVPGNHDCYGGTLPDRWDALRAAGEALGVHVLERDAVVIDGVAFLGCTLWTDLELRGSCRTSARIVRRCVADYQTIALGPALDLPGTPADAEPRRLQPHDTVRLHHASVRWIQEALLEHAGRPTVIVTHHAPSARSLTRHERGPIGAAYASRLDGLVAESGARCWVHGHTHAHRDYHIGGTRVVCNARGYAGETVEGFDPHFVVEI